MKTIFNKAVKFFIGTALSVAGGVLVKNALTQQEKKDPGK